MFAGSSYVPVLLFPDTSLPLRLLASVVGGSIHSLVISGAPTTGCGAELNGSESGWNRVPTACLQVKLHMVSTIALVISIGFAVDYSAHLCHTFTHCKGETREKRCVFRPF